MTEKRRPSRYRKLPILVFPLDFHGMFPYNP